MSEEVTRGNQQHEPTQPNLVPKRPKPVLVSFIHVIRTHPGLVIQVFQNGIRVIIPSEVELAAGAEHPRLVGDPGSVPRTARTHLGVASAEGAKPDI